MIMSDNSIIVGSVIALVIPIWLIKHLLQEILDELKKINKTKND